MAPRPAPARGASPGPRLNRDRGERSRRSAIPGRRCGRVGRKKDSAGSCVESAWAGFARGVAKVMVAIEVAARADVLALRRLCVPCRKKDGAGSAAGSGARHVRASLASECGVGAREGGKGADSPGSGARHVRASLASDVNRQKSSVTLTRWRAESLAHFEGHPKTLLFYD